jgi:hypothetical protein
MARTHPKASGLSRLGQPVDQLGHHKENIVPNRDLTNILQQDTLHGRPEIQIVISCAQDCVGDPKFSYDCIPARLIYVQ